MAKYYERRRGVQYARARGESQNPLVGGGGGGGWYRIRRLCAERRAQSGRSGSARAARSVSFVDCRARARPWTGPVWSMPLTRTKDAPGYHHHRHYKLYIYPQVLLSRNAVVELALGSVQRWQNIFFLFYFLYIYINFFHPVYNGSGVVSTFLWSLQLSLFFYQFNFDFRIFVFFTE